MSTDSELLRSIDRRLGLLTVREELALRNALDDAYLRTSARRRMFWSLDGARTAAELAQLGGVTERAAQMFIREMDVAGLATISTEGRALIATRDDDAVLAWYVRQQT